MNKRNLSWKACVAAVELGLVGLLIWALSLNRTELIISMGIQNADRLLMAARIGWPALAVLTNLTLLLAYRRNKRLAARAASNVRLTFTPDAVKDPQTVREEMLRICRERPMLAEALKQGIDQLDNIERKKKKMQDILTRNDLSLLSDASGALDAAEQTIVKKLLLACNRAILCDPYEKNARRKEAVYAEHMRYISGFLGENEDILNRCEKLLAQTVSYVEEKRAGHDSIDVQLMTDVISSLTSGGIRIDNTNGGKAL